LGPLPITETPPPREEGEEGVYQEGTGFALNSYYSWFKDLILCAQAESWKTPA